MIEIKMTGMCEGCDHAELKLEDWSTNICKTKWVISCSYYRICEAMWKKAKGEAET